MAVKSFIYWNISKNEYNKIKYESIYTNKWLYSTFPREIKKNSIRKYACKLYIVSENTHEHVRVYREFSGLFITKTGHCAPICIQIRPKNHTNVEKCIREFSLSRYLYSARKIPRNRGRFMRPEVFRKSREISARPYCSGKNWGNPTPKKEIKF